MQQVGKVKHVGKIFLKTGNENNQNCDTNNGSAANKAKDLVNSVSGEEILSLMERSTVEAQNTLRANLLTHRKGSY
ncbi:variable large family protein [Borreliella burgdorferi]